MASGKGCIPWTVLTSKGPPWKWGRRSSRRRPLGGGWNDAPPPKCSPGLPLTVDTEITSDLSVSSAPLTPGYRDVLLAQGESSEILTLEDIQKIDAKLPMTMQGCEWKRVYSLSHDGSAFRTFFSRVKGKAPTVVVLKTTAGEIFGGFTTTEWRANGRHFYGDYGDCFLFKIVPAKDVASACAIRDTPLTDCANEPKTHANTPSNAPTCTASGAGCFSPRRRHAHSTHRTHAHAHAHAHGHAHAHADAHGGRCACLLVEGGRVEVYRWTVLNGYCMFSTRDALGMGGGRDGFALYMTDDFLEGSSSSSDTFDNPPLASTHNFQVQAFECWVLEDPIRHLTLHNTWPRMAQHTPRRSVREVLEDAGPGISRTITT